jgi:hypothetical protein
MSTHTSTHPDQGNEKVDRAMMNAAKKAANGEEDGPEMEAILSVYLILFFI